MVSKDEALKNRAQQPTSFEGTPRRAEAEIVRFVPRRRPAPVPPHKGEGPGPSAA
jgi:hypothetical protein